ncbi:hypothetical protein AM1_4020 [Acaryochloris marina MBIC11017]|uniref:Uncharacterized protein n=1 Tax=Acaryochloris marina (strain MBIC 11017) TaxID=329726 RepID=B0C9J0_ACAM1|nr:hypothetical protein AM1_4020 [Acaryochloris marina MBIC11017]
MTDVVTILAVKISVFLKILWRQRLCEYYTDQAKQSLTSTHRKP